MQRALKRNPFLDGAALRPLGTRHLSPSAAAAAVVLRPQPACTRSPASAFRTAGTIPSVTVPSRKPAGRACARVANTWAHSARRIQP